MRTNILIVVDMQKDFVAGALGTKEAVAIVPNVIRKIEDFRGKIYVTLDTHGENYMSTAEGKKLPVPHCIKYSDGWKLDARVNAALEKKTHTVVEKPTFGSIALPALLRENHGEDLSIELVGLCTDICVISNALLLKAHFPECEIRVDSTCCAGVTPESHEAALTAMRMCQIEVI